MISRGAPKCMQPGNVGIALKGRHCQRDASCVEKIFSCQWNANYPSTTAMSQTQPGRTNSWLVYFLLRYAIEFAFHLGPVCFSSIQSDKRQSDDGAVVEE